MLPDAINKRFDERHLKRVLNSVPYNPKLYYFCNP